MPVLHEAEQLVFQENLALHDELTRLGVPAGPSEPRADLPVIVDAFSRTRDEIAGETPSEIALNYKAAVQVSLRNRGRPLRRPRDPWIEFRPWRDQLSPQACAALAWVAQVHREFSKSGAETQQPDPTL